MIATAKRIIQKALRTAKAKAKRRQPLEPAGSLSKTSWSHWDYPAST